MAMAFHCFISFVISYSWICIKALLSTSHIGTVAVSLSVVNSLQNVHVPTIILELLDLESLCYIVPAKCR